MATYASYKTLTSENFTDGSVTSAKLGPGAGHQYYVKWIYNERGKRCEHCADAGDCCEQANGKCCLWTVPSNVNKVTFEIWSGGGGGPGHTCCNNCSFTIGGAGGNYASRTIATSPGCQYTVCAGGAWPCGKSHGCTASMGCRSYVNGHNLSNFCTEGACGGWMCNGDAWGPRHTHFNCENCRICGMFGNDFGMMGSTGWNVGHGGCHCNYTYSGSGQTPLIGKMNVSVTNLAWCNCGCHIEWPAGGGMPGVSSYCGNWAKCCAGGSGQGGSGVVRITFM